MSTPTPVRALLRHTSRLPASSLPLRASQRCIHQTSRLRKKDAKDKDVTPQGYYQTHTGPLAVKAYKIGQPSTTRRDVPAGPRNVPAAEDFPSYTPEEIDFLRRKYTPEQMEAILAGEGAISAQDLQDQGVARNDSMKPEYLEDFSRIHPILDKKRQPPASHEDPNLRYKTEDEMDEDLTRWVDGLSEEPEPAEWHKFEDNMRFMVGKEEAERQPIDYLQPALPKMTDPLVKRVSKKDHTPDYAMKDAYAVLSKQTGLSVEYMRGLLKKTISQNFVSNQTRMGKIRSMYVLVIAGNGNGLVGIGEGKHTEGGIATTQATMNAIRNMQPVPRYEQRTIYGDVRGKVSGTVVELYHRPPGFGVRCQEKIWEVARCAGITDLAAKTLRSSNKMNTIKATVQALQKQRLPEVVAKARGKKMVDVRKVYYAGGV